MEAEARYTWVGAGVLLLIAALVSAVLWLRNIGSAADFKHYAIYFENQPVDGLSIGADVLLRGLKIGRVDDYALADEQINRVRVEVRVDRRAPVLTNTVAVITRNFVTGIANVTLVTGVPAGEPLTEVPEDESYPVIAEGRSDLEEIAGRVNKVGEMASTALLNLNRVFDENNREATAQTLRNLRDLSAGLNERLAALDRTLARVGGAADTFARAAQRVGNAGDRVAQVVEDGAGHFDRTLVEAERTLVEARATLHALTQASETLQTQATTATRTVTDVAERADDQLGATLVEMRLSIEAATRVIDRLRDPHAALLGPGKAQLGPGEVLP
ncbi:MAG: MlaD family protein [Rubrivivax sp.]|nr:MlaD family protein [Rubrivivax sp.]